MRSELQLPCGFVSHKPGVCFDEIAPGGFVILSAVETAAQDLKIHLTLTSGTDGKHSGPLDPHLNGRAYDLSVAGFLLSEIDEIIEALYDSLPEKQFTILLESPIALTGSRYGVTLNPNATATHLHLQVKKGTVYPPVIVLPIVTEATP